MSEQLKLEKLAVKKAVLLANKKSEEMVTMTTEVNDLRMIMLETIK